MEGALRLSILRNFTRQPPSQNMSLTLLPSPRPRAFLLLINALATVDTQILSGAQRPHLPSEDDSFCQDDSIQK